VPEPASFEHRFEAGVDLWLSGLAFVRDAVRQELVRRQLSRHLGEAPPSLHVLDVGCGQGTQAIGLARLGHRVVGLDLSERLLDAARAAAGAQPGEVRDRLDFGVGDLLALSNDHVRKYDLVCCHGVAMYLPSLDETVSALAAACRPGGLISLVTRNRAGIAMRAGMIRDWTGAVEGFDARHYRNRLGIDDVRADEPREVQDALARVGAITLEWYGIRLFTDHWAAERPDPHFPQLLAAEEQAGLRDPYRSLAALTHTVAETRRAEPL
jgi:SAM-dependent methyltransferase